MKKSGIFRRFSSFVLTSAMVITSVCGEPLTAYASQGVDTDIDSQYVYTAESDIKTEDETSMDMYAENGDMEAYQADPEDDLIPDEGEDLMIGDDEPEESDIGDDTESIENEEEILSYEDEPEDILPESEVVYPLMSPENAVRICAVVDGEMMEKYAATLTEAIGYIEDEEAFAGAQTDYTIALAEGEHYISSDINIPDCVISITLMSEDVALNKQSILDLGGYGLIAGCDVELTGTMNIYNGILTTSGSLTVSSSMAGYDTLIVCDDDEHESPLVINAQYLSVGSRAFLAAGDITVSDTATIEGGGYLLVNGSASLNDISLETGADLSGTSYNNAYLAGITTVEGGVSSSNITVRGEITREPDSQAVLMTGLLSGPVVYDVSGLTQEYTPEVIEISEENLLFETEEIEEISDFVSTWNGSSGFTMVKLKDNGAYSAKVPFELVRLGVEETVIGRYTNWTDAERAVSAINDKNGYYQIEINASEIESLNGFKQPKAAASITYSGPDDEPVVIKYTGGIALVSNTVFENIFLVNGIYDRNKNIFTPTDTYKTAAINLNGHILTISKYVYMSSAVNLTDNKNGAFIIDDGAQFVTECDNYADLSAAPTTEVSAYAVSSDSKPVVISGLLSNVGTLTVPRKRELILSDYIPGSDGRKAGTSLSCVNLNIMGGLLGVTADERYEILPASVAAVNLYVGASGGYIRAGSLKLTNVTIDGDREDKYVTIESAGTFDITGNFVCHNSKTLLVTAQNPNLKNSAVNTPFLNVSGDVVLGSADDRPRIMVGEFENGVYKKPVVLSDAPNGSGVLLTASKADAYQFAPYYMKQDATTAETSIPASCYATFDPEDDTTIVSVMADPEETAFSTGNTNGYILKKVGQTICLYPGEDVCVAVATGIHTYGAYDSLFDDNATVGSIEGYFDTWQEAVDYVNTQTGSEYTFILINDIGGDTLSDKPVTFSMPKQGKKEISIISADKEDPVSFYYTNTPSFTSWATVENVILTPVKSAKAGGRSGYQGTTLGLTSTRPIRLYLKDVTLGSSGKNSLGDAYDIPAGIGDVKLYSNSGIYLYSDGITMKSVNSTVEFHKSATITDKVTNAYTLILREDCGEVNIGGSVNTTAGVYVYYGGNLKVGGDVIVKDGYSSFEAYEGSQFCVGGSIKAKDVLSMETVKPVSVGGSINAGGKVSFSGPAEIGGSITANDNIYIRKASDIRGSVSARGDIYLGGVTSIGANLTTPKMAKIEADVTVGGKFSADTLRLVTLSGNPKTVLNAKGTVKISQDMFMILGSILDTSENGGALVEINSVSVTDGTGPKIIYSRAASKNNPNGVSNLKIKELISDHRTLYLELNDPDRQATGLGVANTQTNQVKLMPANLIAALGSNVNLYDITYIQGEDTYKLNTDSNRCLVYANGGLYWVDAKNFPLRTSLAKLEWKAKGDNSHNNEVLCLDLAETVKLINAINNSSGEYTIWMNYYADILGYTTVADTNLSDANKFSSFTLPDNNKAGSVMIKSRFDATPVDVKFYGNIQSYGNLGFEMIRLLPRKNSKTDEPGSFNLTSAKNKAGECSLTVSGPSYPTFVEGKMNNLTGGELVLNYASVNVAGKATLSDVTLDHSHLITDGSAAFSSLSLVQSDYRANAQAVVGDVTTDASAESYIEVTQNKKALPMFKVTGQINVPYEEEGRQALFIRVLNEAGDPIEGDETVLSKLTDIYRDVDMICAAKAPAESIYPLCFRLQNAPTAVNMYRHTASDKQNYIYSSKPFSPLCKVEVKHEEDGSYEEFTSARSWDEAIGAINAAADAGAYYRITVCGPSNAVWTTDTVFNGDYENPNDYKGDSKKELKPLSLPKANAARSLEVVPNGNNPTFIYKGGISPATDISFGSRITLTSSSKQDGYYKATGDTSITVPKAKTVTIHAVRTCPEGFVMTSVSGAGTLETVSDTYPYYVYGDVKIDNLTVDKGTLSVEKAGTKGGNVTVRNLSLVNDGTLKADGTLTVQDLSCLNYLNSKSEGILYGYGPVNITDIHDVNILTIYYPFSAPTDKAPGRSLLSVKGRVFDVSNVIYLQPMLYDSEKAPGAGIREYYPADRYANADIYNSVFNTANPAKSYADGKDKYYEQKMADIVDISTYDDVYFRSSKYGENKPILYPSNGGLFLIYPDERITDAPIEVAGYVLKEDGISHAEPKTYHSGFRTLDDALKTIDKIGSKNAGTPNSFFEITLRQNAGSEDAPVNVILPSKCGYISIDGRDLYTIYMSNSTLTLKSPVTKLMKLKIVPCRKKGGIYAADGMYSISGNKSNKLITHFMEGTEGEDHYVENISLGNLVVERGILVTKGKVTVTEDIMGEDINNVVSLETGGQISARDITGFPGGLYPGTSIKARNMDIKGQFIALNDITANNIKLGYGMKSLIGSISASDIDARNAPSTIKAGKAIKAKTLYTHTSVEAGTDIKVTEVNVSSDRGECSLTAENSIQITRLNVADSASDKPFKVTARNGSMSITDAWVYHTQISCKAAFTSTGTCKLEKNSKIESTNGAVTFNDLSMGLDSDDDSSMVQSCAGNVTVKGLLALNGGTLAADGTSDKAGTGVLTLNNIQVKGTGKDGNYLQARENSKGNNQITVNGTITDISTGREVLSAAEGDAPIRIVNLPYTGTEAENVSAGAHMLNAKYASDNWFRPENTAEGTPGAYKSGSGIYAGPVNDGSVRLVKHHSVIDATGDVYDENKDGIPDYKDYVSYTDLPTFGDAVTEINNLSAYKKLTAPDGTNSKFYEDYEILLNSDVEIKNSKGYTSLALPSKAGSLTIADNAEPGMGTERSIKFNSNVTLKSNLVLDRIQLVPTKTTGVGDVNFDAGYTLGNYMLTFAYINGPEGESYEPGYVGTVSGTAKTAGVSLDASKGYVWFTPHGKVNVYTLTLSSGPSSAVSAVYDMSRAGLTVTNLNNHNTVTNEGNTLTIMITDRSDIPSGSVIAAGKNLKPGDFDVSGSAYSRTPGTYNWNYYRTYAYGGKLLCGSRVYIG